MPETLRHRGIGSNPMPHFYSSRRAPRAYLSLLLLLVCSCVQANRASPPSIPVIDAGVNVDDIVVYTPRKPTKPTYGDAPIPTELVIVPRKDWDPSPRHVGFRYGGPKATKNVYRTIVVHHSDFVEPPGPLAIKDYHLDVSGFGDIGYHFVIGADGTVYEARDLDRMGAHAGISEEARKDHTKDPDWGALGIVLDGFFHYDAPSKAQLAALELLIADLQKRFPKIERVIGHREVRALVEEKGLHPVGDHTTCPGEALFEYVDARRAKPAAKPATVFTKVVPSVPSE